MSGFVHLHLHTEYSLLDSFVRINELPTNLKKLGFKSSAITDKANLFGAVDFFISMKREGLKSIIGSEINLKNGRVLCYAKNEKGYINLVKLVSKSQSGYERNMVIDEEFLFEHSDGLIVLIGLIDSEFFSVINRDEIVRAKNILKKYREVFGEENVFIQISKGLCSKDDSVYSKKIEFSKLNSVELVATNEVYFLAKEDSKYRDVLKCIGNSSKRSDDKRDKLPSDEYYLKSEAEMRSLFSEIPQAVDNTLKIAEKCFFEFDFSKHYLPKFDLPSGISASQKLKELCFEGAKKRFGEKKLEDKIEIFERLNYELDVIKNMGFDDYFLICADFVSFAKSKGILVGPARGSGGGSLACYVLGITDINPLKYNLIFERFLNPERISMPDLDIDFQDDRRHEVIEYVSQKYGKNRVAQIVTFGTLSARAIIRDVARVLELNDVDKMAKAIPNSLNMTLERALKESSEFKRISNSSRLNREVLDISIKLEGLPRHSSTHAAGLVISKSDMTDIVPTFIQGGQLCTQYNMKVLEKLGLLKMDFLGIRYLTIINKTLENIKKNTGVELNIQDIDYSDKKTYELLSSGKTLGVFQLESKGMISFLRSLKPKSIDDIIVGISLYRPGPMDSIPLYIKNRNNPKRIEYLHPLLKPILEETYGCIVYQEQVMRIVRDLAGFSYGRSDLIRRAMSKKKLDIMEQERHNFIYGIPEEGVSGALNKGISEEVCIKIYDDMIDFAKYAFNKSHATGYAYISYQTAYLKANYTREYMSSLLSSVSGSQSAIKRYVDDAIEMGIQVLGPSVLKSKGDFTVEGKNIRFGLSAIKNIGTNLIENVEKIQSESFPKDIFDFYKALNRNVINKKSAESLILSGALNTFGINMSTLVQNFDNMFASVHQNGRYSEFQMSIMDVYDEALINTKYDIKRVDEYDKRYIEKCRLDLLGTVSLNFDDELYVNSLYIRMKKFDLNEKNYIERLVKSDDGYKLYVFDLSTNKMREYVDRIFFDDTVKNDLTDRYGKENIVIK